MEAPTSETTEGRYVLLQKDNFGVDGEDQQLHVEEFEAFGKYDNIIAGQIQCQAGSPPGADYTGQANTTVSGRTCQKWSLQTPHSHSYSVGDHNFCRNPATPSLSGVWCYTTDPKVRYELCAVPFCPVPACEGEIELDV